MRPASPDPAFPDSAGTIVLIEDNDGVRHVMTMVLRAARYTVFDFSDGADAIEMLRNYVGPLDMLVTDAVLPRVSGAEVAAFALQRRPELSLLFMSGYPRELVADGILAGPNHHFLAKPFDMTKIADHVAQLLSVDSRPPDQAPDSPPDYSAPGAR